MPETKITFEIRNDLSEVDSLCETLKGFCHQAGLPDKCISDVNLAAEELFTNIAIYGFKDQDVHLIRFTLSCEGETIRMRIEDDGIPFNPVAAEDPDLESLPEHRSVGGLGVYLAKKVMDEVIYERCGNKNRVTLKKKFRKT